MDAAAPSLTGTVPLETERCDVIGTLLAIVSRIVSASADRHRGGAGVYRCLQSIIVTLFSIGVLVWLRLQSGIRRISAAFDPLALQRLLNRPPQRWAAP
ncbi:hypothetical protein [Sphingomonas panni]|uniref:hypothetical protein n=1 Tax=Sphingomonas panni TaxID=237612 RepID=UPI001F5B3E29|nr:hypothetical protein [Sphingomonas panni]